MSGAQAPLFGDWDLFNLMTGGFVTVVETFTGGPLPKSRSPPRKDAA